MKGLTTAAGAVLLLVGAAACGSAQASTSGTTPAGASAPGTGSSGSGGFAARGASGQVAGLNGQTMTVNTARGKVTVDLGPSTSYSQLSPATLADVTTGACVVVTGQPDASGILVGSSVRLSPSSAGRCANPGRPAGAPAGGAGRPSGSAGGVRGGFAAAAGLVTAVNGDSITLKQASGSVRQVSVTPTARVTLSAPATASALAAGDCVAVRGTTAASGTVTAQAVSITPAQPDGTCAFGGFRTA